MKRQQIFPVVIVIINHLLWMIVEFSDAKYLVHANDSVHLEKCKVEDVRKIDENNPNPEEIIIHDCHVEILPNALFIRFHRLRQLEITESQLHTISDFALNGMKSVQLLNFSRNNLTSVSVWTNEPLTSLHLFDLRRNSISQLDKDAFIHYPNLIKLNLAVNQISNIPDDIFRSLSSLRYLNLAKNYLTVIDANTFKHLHKLLNLELRHNQIEWIDYDSFTGSDLMKVLHLQENSLKTFPPKLMEDMTKLHHLNLSHNRLDELSDETFAKNKELISLDITYNNLEVFTELTFKGLKVLEVLNASHNAIKFIDNTTFSVTEKLQYLDLSHNQLSHLQSEIFSNLPQIISLKLNNNSIELIATEAFANLKLKHLDLSCNKLSTDDFLLPSSFEVEYLNLTFNDFADINFFLLSQITVDLWGNPFKCEWLVREVLTSKNVHLGRNYIIGEEESNQDISKIEGIECFDMNGTEPHKLLVVVQFKDTNENEEDEDDVEIDGSSSSYHQKRRNNLTNLPSSTNEDDFDFRSILLWLSLGCTLVFIGLRILRCYLKNSEQQSENYRQRTQIEVLSTDDNEFKSSSIDTGK